jgi:hypothetical protein
MTRSGRRLLSREVLLVLAVLPMLGGNCQPENPRTVGGVDQRPRDAFVQPLPPHPWRVLGIQSRVTMTGNLPNSTTVYSEPPVMFSVPNGTEQVLVVPRYWYLGYGAMANPTLWGNCLQTSCQPSGFLVSGTKNHSWGMGLVDVYVEHLDAPVPEPQSQNVTVRVQLQLTDVNGDDPWFGYVVWDAIFLGPAPPMFRGPQGPEGPQGGKGAAGNPGAQGAQGAKGATGSQGNTGPKGPSEIILGGGTPLQVSGNATQFEPLFYGIVDPTEANVQQAVGVDGSLSRFSVRLSTAPTGMPMTFTVRKNGADTAVTCTVAVGQSSCQDTVDSATFAAADLIAVRSAGGSMVNPKMNWTAKYTLP